MKKLMTCSMLMLAYSTYAQTLKLVFVKGHKYEITTTSTLNSTASVMGQEMESNTSYTLVQAVEVKDTRANETDLVSVTKKILVNAQMMGQEMIYDSEKKDNTGPLAESLDKMVGKIKNITIDASGKVIKEDKEETEDGMGSMFSGISNISLLKQALIGREYKTGASWPDSVSDNSEKMKNKTVGTYTVSDVNKETHTAVILFTGTQTGEGTVEQMGQEMGITTSNKVEDHFEVDMNTGILSRSSSNINGTSNVEAAGMVIPATTKSTSVTTIKNL